MKNVPFMILFFTLLSFANISFAQNDGPLYFSSQDNMRGWHWDGTQASYVAVLDGKSYLFTRSFNGYKWGSVSQKLEVSKGDTFRGWCLNGTTATYLGYVGGETYLFVRSFDSGAFGPVKTKIKMSSRDNFYSWQWDGKIAVYHAYHNGSVVVFERPFDGKTLGPVSRQTPLTKGEAQNLKGASTDAQGQSSFPVFRNGKTFIYAGPPHRFFTGRDGFTSLNLFWWGFQFSK